MYLPEPETIEFILITKIFLVQMICIQGHMFICILPPLLLLLLLLLLKARFLLFSITSAVFSVKQPFRLFGNHFVYKSSERAC